METPQASIHLPSKLQQAVTAGELGSWLKSYTISWIEVGKHCGLGIVSLLMGCVLGIPGVFSLLAAPGFGDKNPSAASDLLGSAVLLLFALLFLCGGSVVLSSAIQIMGQKIHLFQQGFVLVRWGRARVYSWSQLQTIRQRITRHYKKTAFGEKYKGTTYVYTIKRTDGKKLELDNQVKDVGELGETITRQFSTFLLPTMLASLKAGETLDFGPWKINLQGICNKKGLLPWQDVQKYQIVGGRIHILREKGAGYWDDRLVGFIPNILVFTSLVDSLLKVQQRA